MRGQIHWDPELSCLLRERPVADRILFHNVPMLSVMGRLRWYLAMCHRFNFCSLKYEFAVSEYIFYVLEDCCASKLHSYSVR